MPKWSYDEEAEEFKGDSLYFIREGDDGPIKIGRGDPQDRLKRLQTGNPRRLQVIGHLPNEGFYEALWHAAFAQWRMVGEWFVPTVALQRAIKWALQGEAWIDEVPCPAEIDSRIFREIMLDARDIYMDLVFDGQSEVASAGAVINRAWFLIGDSEGKAFPDPMTDEDVAVAVYHLECAAEEAAPAILAEIERLKDTPNGH